MRSRVERCVNTVGFARMFERAAAAMGSRCGPAAVDGDDLAGDERHLSGGGKYDCDGDLFRPASAFQRYARDQPCPPVGVAGEPIEHRGLDWAGRNGVDTDTECRTFQRRRLSQPFDSMLAGRIKRCARRRAMLEIG